MPLGLSASLTLLAMTYLEAFVTQELLPWAMTCLSGREQVPVGIHVIRNFSLTLKDIAHFVAIRH